MCEILPESEDFIRIWPGRAKTLSVEVLHVRYGINPFQAKDWSLRERGLYPARTS